MTTHPITATVEVLEARVRNDLVAAGEVVRRSTAYTIAGRGPVPEATVILTEGQTLELGVRYIVTITKADDT